MLRRSARNTSKIDYLAMASGNLDDDLQIFSDVHDSDSEDAAKKSSDAADAKGAAVVTGDVMKSTSMTGEPEFAGLDDAALDERLRAAEDQRRQLDAAVVRAQKIQRIKELERENARRASGQAGPRGAAKRNEAAPTSTHAPAIGKRHQDRHTLAELRANTAINRKASEMLGNLGLVSDADSDFEADNDLSNHSHHCHKGNTKSKLKSGMTAKATDVVLYPQFWAQVALPLEQVGRAYSFTELDFRLLVAGELEIITADTTSENERSGRLCLLKRVTYNMGVVGWAAAKNLYAAVLRKIELGLMDWASDFAALEHTVILKAQRNEGTSSGKKRSTGSAEVTVWYCKNFQSNSCDQTEPHQDALPSGKVVRVEHFCAECFAKDKKKLPHPRSDSKCPNRKN